MTLAIILQAAQDEAFRYLYAFGGGAVVVGGACVAFGAAWLATRLADALRRASARGPRRVVLARSERAA